MLNKGKGNKDRVVPLLMLYFNTYKPIYWLFEGQDQISQYSDRSVQEVVKKAARKAGIAQTVTSLHDGGTQIGYIKELLGHADIHPVGLSIY